ncbi:NAD(P)H-hydrate epimerase [uncultured Rubinisphaera sp.]|uniref:NAD(P)H-hydrate epimerase n=1 Tax=uncultured Rubinisphaera sp. TaxID=1678686 RepID=UPI000ECC50EB|nr:NAD(P)H-hydrate epimerase [Planctomycetaceae bacterium]|tara:strand:- start:12417 stop:13112 length:696 start_codon:yes stop_codon:yes gene_type:complete
MPELVLTSSQSRRVDQLAIEKYGVPSLVLMENAGRGCAEIFLVECIENGPTVIVCGKGNNAGDGFVIARHLYVHQEEVEVLMLFPPEELSEDARINFEIIDKIGISHRLVDPHQNAESIRETFDGAEWIMDAMLGTGISGEVREPFATMIQLMNEAESEKLAIDLPSGLDADSGEILGSCVNANATVTFAAKKIGLLKNKGPQQSGEIHVVGLGIPNFVIQEAMSCSSESS